MRYATFGRVFVIALISVTMLACDGSSSSPVAPTSTPAAAPSPTPAPTPAIPQLGGDWVGTYEYTQNDNRGFITIAVTLSQTNRNVSGTWRSTFEGNSQNGDFTGTIIGEGSSAVVSGTVNIIAETARQTGRCHARATVTSENAVSATSLRLVGPNIQLLDCGGNIRGLVWILGRR